MKPLVKYFGEKELREINPMQIERFRTSRLKAGNSKSTTNRYLALLKRIFNIAIEEGYVDKNPVQKVKFYSEKDNLRERVLTEEEEMRLMDAGSEHLKSILVLTLNTGMRKGEILSLQWHQIDLKTNIIRVEKTKSGRIRKIPISNPLRNELLNVKCRSKQSSYVFVNPKTRQRYKDIRTAFKAACRRVKIEGLTFHGLRHTFGIRLFQKGVDIVTVQNLLGHQSIATTQRYTHSSIKQKREAVELLAEKVDEMAEKKQRLSHIWHTAPMDNQKGSLQKPANRLISMN